MKKILRFICYFGLCLFGLIAISRALNLFQYYKAPTIANEPTLQIHASMLGSKLITPKRLDFIWFMGDVLLETDSGRVLNLYRLCGVEGDTIEIRNGNLFVNSKDIDKGLKLSHNYLVSHSELENIESLMTVNSGFVETITKDTVSVPLSDEFVKENSIRAIRLVYPKSFRDSLICGKFNQAWNVDNFGPIVVPPSKYFVLGDNRHHAMDSRFKGFIDKADYSSTVFWRQ